MASNNTPEQIIEKPNVPETKGKQIWMTCVN